MGRFNILSPIPVSPEAVREFCTRRQDDRDHADEPRDLLFGIHLTDLPEADATALAAQIATDTGFAEERSYVGDSLVGFAVAQSVLAAQQEQIDG